MSAKTIIDTAPLGALIRYTDGSPKPPARFTKKLAAWERSNGVGRLVKKELRDAAMVALLAMMPIRHRAFAGLQLGASLIIDNQTLTILLPGELTKTGTLWEAELPEPAAGLLRRYLSDARPYLLARNDKVHDMLWACDNGDPMSYSYVGRRIPQITQVLTGKAIPPHFFRDAAATTLARTSPKAAQLISPVLGHADSRTAERHYIHAGTIEASRDFAALLRQLKKEK